MKIEGEILKLNPWWQGDFNKVISRPYYLDLLTKNKSNTIDIITGARRVGKTSLLKDVINHLIEKGTDPNSIFYITGELPAIQRSSIVDIFSNIDKKKKLYWFIDEVQEIPDWQQQVKYLYDNYDIKFYLTGSSSLILSKQTSKLTGRFIQTHLLPLSFNEFLDFKKIKLSKDRSKNLELAEKYLDTGGYPEYVLNEDISLLTQTVQSIMYRDLLSHYGIRNPAILKDLLELLCDKIGTPVSFNTIAADLKIDPETAQFYVQYLADVFLIYPLYREGKSHKAVKGFVPKYYLNDTGVLRAFSKNPREGHLFENAIFLHLLRDSFKNVKEIYYELRKDKEVDFLFQNLKYESKGKPLTEGLFEDVTYIVRKIDKNFGYKQIELWEFLSQG